VVEYEQSICCYYLFFIVILSSTPITLSISMYFVVDSVSSIGLVSWLILLTYLPFISAILDPCSKFSVHKRDVSRPLTFLDLSYARAHGTGCRIHSSRAETRNSRLESRRSRPPTSFLPVVFALVMLSFSMTKGSRRRRKRESKKSNLEKNGKMGLRSETDTNGLALLGLARLC
jgi:hypothetical protein